MGAIQKRGDRYRALVRKKGHPPLSKSFSKKVLAERWVKETELAIEDGSLTSSKVTVGKLVQQYREEVNKVRPFDRRRIGTLKAIEKAFKGIRLMDLNAKAFMEVITGIANTASTRQEKVVFLVVALRYMDLVHSVKVPWRDIDSAKKMLSKLGVISRSKERGRRITDDELAAVKAKAESVFPMSDLIDFAVSTAMRLSEIMRIRWEDVDRQKRTVIIRDRKHPREKKGNDQEVPLLGKAWEVLDRQPRDGECVFPYNDKSVGTAWRRARDAAGVKGARFHDLRHEGVSRMFEQGYSLPEVAVVSGHRDWNMLRRYTRLKPESLHRDEKAPV